MPERAPLYRRPEQEVPDDAVFLITRNADWQETSCPFDGSRPVYAWSERRDGWVLVRIVPAQPN